MNDFESIAALDIDDFLLLRRGVKVWFDAAAVHGCFHGDVHAGNLWVLDDGRGTYLDFGIMGELPGVWKDLLKDLLKDLFYTSIIDGDVTRVVRAFRRVGANPDEAGTDEEVAEVFKGVVVMLDGLGAASPQELVLVTKQLLYFERCARELASGWALARDLYLVKYIFPDEVAKKAADEGIDLPA